MPEKIFTRWAFVTGRLLIRNYNHPVSKGEALLCSWLCSDTPRVLIIKWHPSESFQVSLFFVHAHCIIFNLVFNLVSDPPKYADLIEIAEKISARLNDHTELVKFGLKLLDEETVKRVKRDCSDKSLRDLCLELLEKWQSSKDKPTCDDVVAAALRAINQRELAKMIEDAKKQSDTQARKRPTDKEQG